MLTLLATLIALSPLPTTAAPAAALVAQDPPADDREDVKAMLAELGQHASERGKEDTQAIAVIDRLVQAFPECGPKDREAIVKGLDKCFKEKRPEDEAGVRQNQIYLSSATALGEMAPESVPVLLSWIGHKSHKKDEALQRLLILRLGKTKDARAMKPLIKLLDDPDAPIIAAAAEAMGEFDGAALDERKAMFEELLKLLMGAKAGIDADNADPIARQRYDTIAAPIVTTLTRLTKHTEHQPEAWQRWWNKNKKEDWDAMGS
jgi:HEAT repeat protein